MKKLKKELEKNSNENKEKIIEISKKVDWAEKDVRAIEEALD